MKKSALMAMAVVVVLGATGAWAMGKDCDKKGGPGGKARMADLSGDQQAKMKAIGEAQRTEMKPLHDQMKVKTAELKALVDGKGTDEALTAKLAEIKTLRSTMQAAVKKYMEQREQVLTPQQRAKMALRMGDRMGMKGGMKGGKGANCAKDGSHAGKEVMEGEE